MNSAALRSAALSAGLTALLAAPFAAFAQAAAAPAPDSATGSATGKSGPVAVLQTAGGVMRAPLFNEELAFLPVARVEELTIPLAELNEALTDSHQAHKAGAPAGGRDFSSVLDRLIGIRLLALEAQAMGMDELPAFKQDAEVFSRMALRTVVQEQLAAGAAPDAAEVDRLYKEAVREWVVDSILFEKLDEAMTFTTAVRTGQSFEGLGKAAVAAKKASGLNIASPISRGSEVLPQVREAVQKLTEGQIEHVKVAEGFAVLRLAGLRYPDSAEALATALRSSLATQRERKKKAGYAALVKAQVKLDQKLLSKLDWEKNVKRFDKALQDKRVLASVNGDPEPITVAQVAAEVKKAFFHSVESAIKEKRGVNEKIVSSFEEMLGKKLLLAEAQRRKVGETPVYQRLVSDHRNEELGQLFLQKVVLPEVKLTEEAGKKYYSEHIADFSFPAFYALQTIGFKTGKTAQAAFDKAKAGTDFKWLQLNSDGLLLPAERAFEPGAGLIGARTMPAPLAALLEGSKVSDLRLYKYGDGQHYLLQVKQAVPATKKEYEAARAEIAKALMPEALKVAIDGWVSKLRAAHKVEVYLTKIEI